MKSKIMYLQNYLHSRKKKLNFAVAKKEMAPWLN